MFVHALTHYIFFFFQSKILHYMRQMAVITPYAQFLFKFISDTPEYVSLSLSLALCPSCFYLKAIICRIVEFSIFFSCRKNITIKFTRRTDVMPPIPIETKHHPSSVDLLLIKRLITDTSKKTLLQFLQHEFVNINKTLATRLIGKRFMTGISF